MEDRSAIHNGFRKIFFFFPIQLLFLHFKRNHFLLFFWLILFGIITHIFGYKFGLGYLFLYPEYLGNVDFFSHLLLGFSCGGFIMAFNMYSYVLHGYKFSFIATVSKPFYKFSINNFIIPAAFVLVYTYQAIKFQYTKEFEPIGDIIWNMSGFYSGMFLFFFFSMYYFFKTNKDLVKVTGKTEESIEQELEQKGVKTALHKTIKWYEMFNTENGWHVDTYMSAPFRIKLARESRHYDSDMLKKILAQNHINASIFEFVMIISFLVLGSLGEFSAFLIPAGASVFLVFTMLIMLISAFYSWLRGWTFTFLIGSLILLNYLSSNTELLSYKNFAYGLDYSGEKAVYTDSAVNQLQSDTLAREKDMKDALESLNLWRKKNDKLIPNGKKKPKFVVVCTSGGGIRSAMWTFHVMQQTDSLLHGTLMDHTHLITGSSGGMIGAAYFRELFFRKQSDPSIDLMDKKYTNNIAKDILNPVAFTLVTNDIFVRYRHFNDGPYSYTIDRGYMFEKTLNQNLDSAFERRLWEYIVPERNAEIPTLLLCPTIINDGRRLIIGSQPLSYLTNCQPETHVTTDPSDEYVEFTKLFKEQNAWNLKFTSALRMNASFPYVMPMVTLPSEPSMEVMDAGYRDNYGIRVAIRYIYVFRNWIESNTDGVVIIQIRDKQKTIDDKKNPNSVMGRLAKPLGNLYDNIFNTQDFDNDQLLQYASGWLKCDLEVVNFHLMQTEKERTSLSWHLTQLEKSRIIESFWAIENNRKAAKRLIELLEK